MTIDMTRHGGSQELAVAECIDQHIGTWRVRTDFQPDMEEDGKTQRGVTFIEAEYPYKPSMQEVKDFVYGVINMQTDEKILTGFVWNGLPVWLSPENQRNFSEADRKAEKNPDILPIVFKIGEQDGQPVYHTFETYEELDGFYTQAFAYIQRCLADGWQQKDAFDFTPYEEALALRMDEVG